jgi:hypothetical protein
MTDPRHISPEDLALHAMQALSSEEGTGVRLHLAECAPCRDELAAVNGDLALLALSTDQQELPAGARARFLNKLPLGAARKGAAETSPVVPIDAKRRSAAAIWIPWLAVAALVVLSAALTFQLQTLKAALQSQAEASTRQAAETARAKQVLEVLSAPAAQHILLTAAKTPPLPSGRAIYLADKGSLIFQGNNLAQLPDTKTYELWVIPANGAAPLAAGLFRPDATGNASVVLPPLPAGIVAKAFGVTIENVGGSTTPTAPIILAGAAPVAGE